MNSPVQEDQSIFTPFEQPVFRMLWGCWLVANICMWMNDVAGAWMMTSMNVTPIWVALVQSAATLPVFLLGLPCGALADILDRRKFLIFTQIWIALIAVILSLLVFFGNLSPSMLIALTFCNGIGLAMRWPVFSSVVPELLPKTQLASGLALNAVSMNTSRVVGPLLAGAIIASMGSAWVYALNAVMSVISALIMSTWKREKIANPLGREKLWSAMRVGVQFISQSAHFKGVLMRIAIFFFSSTALIALLPLVAKNMDGGDAGTFTLVLACMGVGAIGAAVYIPKLRMMYSRDQLIIRGSIVQTIAMVVIAFNHIPLITMVCMCLAGAAWISSANTLSVSAQMGLPDWVRARGMSIYQMAIMGASAFGAALWGQVATVTSVPISLTLAALSGLIGTLLVNYLKPGEGLEDDLTPSHALIPPSHPKPPAVGHIMMTIEYIIDPKRSTSFLDLMQESRRSRLRHGALRWELLHDVTRPERYVEVVEDGSWNDHLRRFDRMSESDVTIRDRKMAFHTLDSPPIVNRYLMESTANA
ncbi:MAG: MFS transporter [Burkholderiaceae bacterium]